MPDDERRCLRQIVDRAHRDGRRVRFWATPEPPAAAAEAVWTELLAAGDDLITTDELAGLRAFLLGTQERAA